MCLLFVCVCVPEGVLVTKTQVTGPLPYPVTLPEKISGSHKYGHFGAKIHTLSLRLLRQGALEGRNMSGLAHGIFVWGK